MAAGIFQREASDLTVSVDDHLADCFTAPGSQGDIHHGVVAGLARDRGADALEAAGGVRHFPPPARQPVHRVTVQPHVEFPACFLPATFDKVAEQRLCPVRRAWWDVLGHWLASVLPGRATRIL